LNGSLIVPFELFCGTRTPEICRFILPPLSFRYFLFPLPVDYPFPCCLLINPPPPLFFEFLSHKDVLTAMHLSLQGAFPDFPLSLPKRNQATRFPFLPPPLPLLEQVSPFLLSLRMNPRKLLSCVVLLYPLNPLFGELAPGVFFPNVKTFPNFPYRSSFPWLFPFLFFFFAKNQSHFPASPFFFSSLPWGISFFFFEKSL